MRIKFGDVCIGEIARKNIQDCLDKHWVTSGEKVKEFERIFAGLSDYKHCVATCSGTAADLLACLTLHDLGAKRGQKIIVPALSFIATQNSVIAAGFQPIPVDIKRETLNLNEMLVEQAIDNDTVAVMCVNTMGKPCKMDVLREICNKHGLLLICDNCEGHFCKYDNKYMSYWADVCTYSFYSAHIIFSVQQGACCTNSDEIYNSLISTRTHGRRGGELMFLHDRFGWNAQPTDLHCSIGLENIAFAQEIFDTRKFNLNYMIKSLKDKGLDNVFYFNLEEEKDFNSPHALSLTFKEDDEERFLRFYSYLENNGIQCKLNFKSVFTQQKAMRWFGCTYVLNEFPEAEFVGRNGLHLACHQYLSKEDLDYIVETIASFK
jgi:dTDP-4-amino-4,6-dideoxygalactose transaminase